MTVLFCEPPPAQRVGGLEAAVNGLRDALRAEGVGVYEEFPATGAENAVDVVHFHGLWQPRYRRIAESCCKAGIPYIVSPHGMLEPWAWKHKAWKKWPYYYLFERSFLQNAACVLATANSEAKRLSKFLPRQRIETLPLGTTGSARPDYENARASLGWKTGEPVLLFLSRLHVKKGLDLLLRALTEVDFPSTTRLVIVGGGEPKYVDSLKSFAQINGARLPRIEWVGEVWGEERWRYFQGADLFCLPTHSENFGLAVLEALQVGTPVLTTRTTPWVDHLTEERGFLADPSAESLKPLLATFFSEPERPSGLRTAISNWAHAGFSWSQLAPKYQQLYGTVRACRHSPYAA